MELLEMLQWRCLTPSDAMNQHAADGWKGKLIHVSGFLSFLDSAIQDLVWPADLVVYQRNIISQGALDALEYWRGMGKPVVVDLDDAYHILPYSNPAWKFWHDREHPNPDGEEERGGALRMLEEGLRRADGLVAPNRILLEGFGYCAKRGYYLQNYAEPAWWTDLPPRDELKKGRGLEDRVIIGWGGSVSHYDSWWGSGLREAAERVTARHPEVVWLICGNDDRIFNQLRVPAANKLAQSGVPPQEWPRTVACFDVGVAPLAGFYDQHRSWIKGVEYALAGVPWVGTGGEPYRDIADLGVLVDNGPDAWQEALEAKLSNLKQEQEAAAANVETARARFLIDRNLHVFAGVYRQIVADFSDDQVRLPGVVHVKVETPTAEKQPAAPVPA